MVKRLPTMWGARVRSLGQEDPLEKVMATHSSILAWKIPWMGELGWLLSMGSQRVGHDWATSLYVSVHGFWLFSRLTVQTSPSSRVPRFDALPFLPPFFLLSFMVWGVLWGHSLQSSHISRTRPLRYQHVQGEGPSCLSGFKGNGCGQAWVTCLLCPWRHERFPHPRGSRLHWRQRHCVWRDPVDAAVSADVCWREGGICSPSLSSPWWAVGARAASLVPAHSRTGFSIPGDSQWPQTNSCSCEQLRSPHILNSSKEIHLEPHRHGPRLLWGRLQPQSINAVTEIHGTGS